MTKSSAIALGALILVSCGEGDPRGAPRTEDQNAKLGGSVAARVGSETIPLEVVASVAAAQNVAPHEAVRRLIDDEIAASAARSRGHDRRVPASWRLVSVRARLTADRLGEEARDLGPPTDAEVATLSSKYWAEVDRPPSVRVMHALVRVKEPAQRTAARALAEELRLTMVTAANDDVQTKAKARQHDPKLEVIVEQLPAFTDAGKVTEGGGEMDAIFAKTAFALSAEAATSEVTETKFGFHVIRFLERIPEKRMPLESRRLAFTDEVLVLRARERMNVRLKALRKANVIEVSPGAEQLMRTVKVSSESVASP
jgi:parvulin-like peptidyl-prolyl isomerase